MRKKLLLTAGPVPVSEEIQQILNQPVTYHRSENFIRNFESTTQGLQYLFQTKNDALILTASGSGGMEAAISNLFSPGDQILVVENGKFSQRWSEMALKFQLDVNKLEIPWGKSVTAAEVTKKISSLKSIKGIFLTHCETSTGALTDLETIVPAIREQTKALVIVDAISSAGILPLKMDDWGIDVIVSASHKGLGLPPGLAFVALNNRAWICSEQAELPRYYFDLIRARQALLMRKGSAFTPAIPLILAAEFTLEKIKKQGLANIWTKQKQLADYFRQRLKDAGFEIFPDFPSDSLTVIKAEPLLNPIELASILNKKFDIIVSRGQASIAREVIRVGHLVNIGESHLNIFLEALQKILSDNSKK